MRRISSLAILLALLGTWGSAYASLTGWLFGPVSAVQTWFGATLPTPPTTFSTTMPSISCANTNRGSCYTPGVGGDSSLTLQQAINDAAADSGTKGDIVECQAGATYDTGSVTSWNLPVRAGSGTIYVISTDAPEIGGAGLPSAPSRVGPNAPMDAAPLDLSKLCTLHITGSTGNPVLGRSSAAGVSDYRLIGLAIQSQDSNQVSGHNEYVVELNDSDTSTATLAQKIVLDRDYILGSPNVGAVHCYQIDGAYNALIDSYVEGCYDPSDADTQAVIGWNGTGPYQIENNWMHAGGETTMWGGADSTIPNIYATDIDIENNHYYKSIFNATASVNATTTLTITAVTQDELHYSMLMWTEADGDIPAGTYIVKQLTGTGGASCPDSTCNGTTGTYQMSAAATGTATGDAVTFIEQGKNMGEFKAVDRVLWKHNFFENAGASGQSRSASTITARNQSGGNTSNVVSDIDIEDNVYTNALFGGVNLLLEDNAYAGNYPTLPSYRILYRNNLFLVTESSGGSRGYTGGTWIASNGQNITGSGGQGGDVVFDHDTFIFLNGESYFLGMDGDVGSWTMALINCVWSNDIFDTSTYETFIQNGTSGGTYTQAVLDNVTDPAFVNNVIIGGTKTYPSGNFLPARPAVDFTSYGSATSSAGYALTGASPYHAAGVSGTGLPYTSGGTADGTDIGANVSLLPTS